MEDESKPKSPKPSLFRQHSGMGRFNGGESIWIDPYTHERIWVFNPMHIVNLSKQTKSRFVRIVEGFKNFSNRWFSHVLLLMFLILYGFLGAYIFVTLEAPIETSTKNSVISMRERIIKELWWSSRQFSKGWWQRLAKIRLKEYEKQLYESCLADQATDSEQRVWSFWQALFFSSTIFTTIGYGHVVPKTDAGRVASIIYAFIGIPLLLMVLTDLGKLFTRGIKFVFKYWRKLYYNRQLRKMRRATMAQTQFVSQTFDAVNRKMSTVMPLRGKLFNKDGEPSGVGADGKVDTGNVRNGSRYVAVTLLLLYMMAGAAVFTIWEKWTFFESFYFVYISLSTIGFGDYVPEHPAFMMCTFIYLLFGLALTSMCINVVQEKLSSTFQKAKLRIGATMGLDISQMVEEELNQDFADMAGGGGGASERPAPILKEEGIGNVLREKREKMRLANQNNDEPSSSKTKPKGKSVDFQE
ncbi:hypothetical protein BLOT_008128 [Blomia tropicalis]|nr:hypothetical protein BLOT_008128 [Blomia tropicalis]